MSHREKEKNNTRLLNYTVYGVSAALCFAATLIYAYPSIKTTTLMYEYSGRVKNLAEVMDTNKKMKLELSTRRSYDFVEERAVRDMGFVFPSQGQVAIVAKRK